MSQLTILGSTASTYVRTVRMLLEEKGMAYDIKDVNFVTGEQKEESYRKHHPYNKMPVLKDGDFSLYETIAICNYLERAYPDGKSLRPDDIKQQAKMERLINCYSSYMFSQMIGNVVWERVVEPLKGASPNENIVNDALPEVKRQMELLNKELTDNKFFIGDSLSLFDLFLAPTYAYLMMVDEVKKIHDSLPALKVWWDNISRLDSFKATA